MSYSRKIDLVVKTSITVPASTLRELDQIVPPRKRSRFVTKLLRDAIKSHTSQQVAQLDAQVLIP